MKILLSVFLCLEMALPAFHEPLPRVHDPLPPELIKAWEEAGATFGYTRRKELTRGSFTPGLPPSKQYRGDLVPAFAIHPQMNLAALPVPQTPFGLVSKRYNPTGQLTVGPLTGRFNVRHLGRFTHLHTVCLANMSDADLKSLTELQKLEVLSLAMSCVTDEGMRDVARLKNLRWLDLSQTRIGDAGLAHLTASPKLQALSLLHSRRVSAEGLKRLARIQTLQKLNLYNTRTTDAGLKALTGLKSLRGLDLGQTKVTDAGMKYVARHVGLKTLSLMAADISDAGLNELAPL